MKIVGQVLASNKSRAEDLAKLKPNSVIEEWNGYYVVTFYEES